MKYIFLILISKYFVFTPCESRATPSADRGLEEMCERWDFQTLYISFQDIYKQF